MISNRFLFWLLIPLVMFGPLGVDIFLPAIPKMIEYFSSTPEQIQATITLYLVAIGLGNIIVGPLADKYGRRRTALIAITVYSIASLLTVVAENTTQLYVIRFIQGFSACGTYVAASATVRDRFNPDQAAAVFSYLNGMLCLIPALAPILGGFLTVNFNWQANFLFMAAFAAVAATTTAVFLPETNPGQPKNKAKLTSRFKEVLSNKNFLTFSFINMSGMACILLYVTYSPIVLMDKLGLNEITFSYWFGINGAINIVTFLLAPRVIKKLGKLTTIKVGIGFLIAGCGWELFNALNQIATPLDYMAPIFVLSIGFSLALGCSAASALAPFGHQAGTAAGLLGCLQMSGAATITTLAQQTSLTGPFALAIVGGVLVLTCTLLVYKLKEQS